MTGLSLLYHWVRRDAKIRYTQTLLGSVWALFQPLAMTAAFVVAFRGVAKVDVGVPYIAFAYSGMVLWTLVGNGINLATSSTASSMYIASKVSYPRIISPIAATLLPLVEFTFGLLLLPFVIAASGAEMRISPRPILLGLVGSLLLTLGVGTLLSAATVFVRDIKLAVPFMVQVALLFTPVAYDDSSRDLSETLEMVFRWNPLATFLRGFRSGLLDVAGPTTEDWVRSLLLSVVALGVGTAYFLRVQHRFNDVA